MKIQHQETALRVVTSVSSNIPKVKLTCFDCEGGTAGGAAHLVDRSHTVLSTITYSG